MSLAATSDVRHRALASGWVSTLLSVGIFYLGLALSLHLVDPIFFRWPLTVVLGGALGLLGWRQLVVTPAMRRYLGWAAALSAWLVISSVAAWASLPLYRARINVLWLLVIVPGLASIFRERARLEAFVGGLVAGGSIFALVAAYRIARGVSVFDLGPTYPDKFDSYNEKFWEARAYMLGQNRNIAAAISLMILPLLLSKLLPQPLTKIRWPLAAAYGVWIIYSGSRLALLGAILVTLVLLVLQPGGNLRLRRLYVVLLAVTTVYVGVQEIGGQARVSFDRLGSGLDEGASTDIRRLNARKSWHLGMDHPVFGIGLGRVAGAYHPVVDEGSNRQLRQQVQNDYPHNGYAGLMAEAGIPGLGLFIGLALALILSAVMHRRSPPVNAAAGMFAVSLLALFARSIFPMTFVAMLLVLATACADENTDEDNASLRSAGALRT